MKKQPHLIGVDTDYGCDVVVLQAHPASRNDFMNRIKNKGTSPSLEGKVSSCRSHRYRPSLWRNGCAKGSTSSQANTVQRNRKATETRKPTCVPDYRKGCLIYPDRRNSARRRAEDSSLRRKDTRSPGTKKGDSYCARSAGQMKKHPKAAKNQIHHCDYHVRSGSAGKKSRRK